MKGVVLSSLRPNSGLTYYGTPVVTFGIVTPVGSDRTAPLLG
jgi:hypothetical protein